MNMTMTRTTAASCPVDGMRFGLSTLAHWQDSALLESQAVISLPIYNSTSATLRSNVPATEGVTFVNTDRVRNGAAKQAAPPRGEPR